MNSPLMRLILEINNTDKEYATNLKNGHSTTGQIYSNKSFKIVLTYSIIAFLFSKLKSMNW
jgi:hypothetical protein